MDRSKHDGYGATRSVALPPERESGVNRVARPQPDSAPLVAKDRPLRLLLVEDSDDDAELVLRELRRGGFVPNVHRVMTQPEFKTALEQSSWDAIVSDHTLPRYAGLAALADLRASGLDIPFILVSGTIGEAVAVEAMRAGAQDYVLKHDLTRLPVAIARELREKAIRADQERMREQLLISERMASAGMLAAGVAHEINNPLAVAVTNVDYAADVFSTWSEKARKARENDAAGEGTGREAPEFDEVGEALRDASEGLRRIRDIVLDVKLFSRPLDSSASRLDIRKVLDSSTRMAWNEIRHRAQLVKDYGSVPLVDANESRLGQVILNLVVNAAHAIGDGHAEANTIRLVARTDDAGWAVVEVSDTGCGIPAKNLERIFDPFFTTKPVGVGTGLGLSICHRIVTELGGRIEVASEVGKGTTFRVALPPAPTAGEGVESKAANSSVRRALVLVVDDEVSMGLAVRRALSAHHDVVSVTRADEALSRIAQGERFDVIFSDVMMPDISGMDLHARLERLAPDQAVRMVFLTGGAFTATAREYLDRVPNRVVEKPFRTSDLLDAVAATVEADAKLPT
jgi:signal transduction histidine kinase